MSGDEPSIVALVPARAGSKRIPDKNIRPLAGHPLLAYAISSARQAGIFDAIVVSTDSAEYAAIARHYGAEVPFLRPAEMSTDTSPDIAWVELTLRQLGLANRTFDCFSILRPTSPFRKAQTIRRAWQIFKGAAGVDSLRAVEKTSQHPGKMWTVSGNRLHPLLSSPPGSVPMHSRQYSALPLIYVQNASLEIAWTRVALDSGTIAGDEIVPFFTEGDEGIDLNHAIDWLVAETMISTGKAKLPEIEVPPYSGKGTE